MEGQTPSSNNKGQETIVFISYAREDAEKARRLYQDLKNAGLNPWLDKKELLPGQNWQNEIEDAISKSRYFIPVFSKTSVMKIGYVQNEFKFALEVFRSYPPDAIFYIPVTRHATFSKEAYFSEATFLSKAYFSGEFNCSTYFNHTIFEEPTKVTFE